MAGLGRRTIPTGRQPVIVDRQLSVMVDRSFAAGQIEPGHGDKWPRDQDPRVINSKLTVSLRRGCDESTSLTGSRSPDDIGLPGRGGSIDIGR